MLSQLEPLVRGMFQAVGIEGVSVSAFLILVLLAMYAHRASAVGGTLAGTASTAVHDLKVVSLTLIVLLVLGVIAFNPGRAHELIQSGMAWVGQEAGRLIP